VRKLSVFGDRNRSVKSGSFALYHLVFSWTYRQAWYGVNTRKGFVARRSIQLS